MKNKEKVAEILATLKNEVESPYELAAIERLENELTNGAPKVEVIDEKHQKFLGFTFHKNNNNRFHCNIGIHQLVWIYHFGKIFDGYIVHHKDGNPANNFPSNLQTLTYSDHQKIHRRILTETQPKINFCKVCGKEIITNSTDDKQFCSRVCQYKVASIRELITRKCVICGKEFSTNKHKNTKTCSEECKSKLISQTKKKEEPSKEIRVCAYCGKSFESIKSHNQKFCSKKCANHHKYQNEKVTSICVICGKEFSHNKKYAQKCCSRKCGYIFRSNKHRVTGICAYCGKEFLTPKKRTKKYCSRTCSNKARSKKK